MTQYRIHRQVDLDGLAQLAGLIALKMRAGDMLALSGELGSGKTTFARALIRACLDDVAAEVPSPTFSLMQTYATPRFEIAHLDLYRIGHEDELLELDLEAGRGGGVLIVEWAERAPSLLGNDRLDIQLEELADPELRSVTLTGSGSWIDRLARVEGIARFFDNRPAWRSVQLRYLQGDASVRAYARVKGGAQSALFMDWPRQPDGPPIRDGLPYSRIAHLAEDVSAFVAIADLLRMHGFRTPHIFESDFESGFLLLEDFGDLVFGREVAAGHDLTALWRAATEVLVRLRTLSGNTVSAVPTGSGGRQHVIPLFDRDALAIEAALLLDWYWPLLSGSPAPEDVRASFAEAWEPLFSEVLSAETQIVLRDFHSPNLIWCRDGVDPASRVGLIDFQDAVRGHAAYDLVSLLQDARLDVPGDVEGTLLAYYCDRVNQTDPEFKSEDFLRAYAILGAQRNTKILGIFARLAMRDGKHTYLAHIPRIWGYLARNLAHSGLEGLRSWYDMYFPSPVRSEIPEA